MKMHLADGYPDVAKCKKVPTEIRKLFQSKLQQAKEDTLKQRQELRKNIIELHRNRFMISMRVAAIKSTRISHLRFVHHWSISIRSMKQ